MGENKHAKMVREYIDHRVLVQALPGTPIQEALVTEVSPSGNFMKLHFAEGEGAPYFSKWIEANRLIIAEVLADEEA